MNPRADFPMTVIYDNTSNLAEPHTCVPDLGRAGHWPLQPAPSSSPPMHSSPGKKQIAASALKHRLATISLYEDHVLAGCLMNYGQNVAEFHQRAARYVDRILKGAELEDLPLEQPTKFNLVINSKTTATLGLAIPRELLIRRTAQKPKGGPFSTPFVTRKDLHRLARN